MRIDNYNTFAQSRLLSRTGSNWNVPLPDYTDFNFNTRKAPAMSDEKYRETIIEQAKKDQFAGKFQSESHGFRSLVKSYVSTFSPDRKKIITEGLTAIFRNKNPQPKTLNLIEHMFGNVKSCKEATDLSYAEFYDSNGEMVASYSNGRWISYGTKAENARESELWGIYNEAWNNAARADKKINSETSTYSTISSIDKSV